MCIMAIRLKPGKLFLFESDFHAHSIAGGVATIARVDQQHSSG